MSKKVCGFCKKTFDTVQHRWDHYKRKHSDRLKWMKKRFVNNAGQDSNPKETQAENSAQKDVYGTTKEKTKAEPHYAN